MLDLNHPMTQHIFEASAIKDALMRRAQQMSVLPSAKRLPLLEQCHYGLDELRRLNRAHFANSTFIAQTINETETALNNIAHAGAGNIVADSSHGEGNCPVCGIPITVGEAGEAGEAGEHSSKVICCGRCVEPFMKAKSKLESPKGFFTCAI